MSLESYPSRFVAINLERGAIIKLGFTTEKSINKMMPALERLYGKELEVCELSMIPEKDVDALYEGFIALAEEQEEEAEREKEKKQTIKEYLAEHPNEYYNTLQGKFKPKPTPVWSMLEPNSGWWRYITPEMYEQDADFYHEFFKNKTNAVAQQVALRDASSLHSFIQDNWRITSYEKRLLDGHSVNINPAGGFNNFDPIEVRVSEREPVSERVDGGLTGILMPDGIWYACGYMGHADLVRWLEKNTNYPVKDAYWNSSSDANCDRIILFSHTVGLGGITSVMYSHGRNITKESREWIDEHLDVMSDDQRMYTEMMLSRDGDDRDTN